MREIKRLLEIMNLLRNKENGCPWDLKQNHFTLKQHLLEEAYEVIEAIDDENNQELKKELGDLLLQIVFHAQIASENNQFDFFDVCKSISDKLERRHPHIFGNTEVKNSEEVKMNWEKIKKSVEGKKRVLDGLPKRYNALLRSERIQDKVASLGFEWSSYHGVLEKLAEEMQELKEGLANNDRNNIEEELGDVLFVLTNLCRKLNFSAEDALQKANDKFIKRFNYIEEKIDNINLEFSNLSEEDLLKLWIEAKEKTRV